MEFVAAGVKNADQCGQYKPSFQRQRELAQRRHHRNAQQQITTGVSQLAQNQVDFLKPRRFLHYIVPSQKVQALPHPSCNAAGKLL